VGRSQDSGHWQHGGTDVQLKTRSWLSFKESEVFVLLDGNWQGVLRGVRVCKRMRQ
jgi:hypothetical protein